MPRNPLRSLKRILSERLELVRREQKVLDQNDPHIAQCDRRAVVTPQASHLRALRTSIRIADGTLGGIWR